MSDPGSESVVTLRELLGDPNTAVRAVSMTEPDSARAGAVAARLGELDIVRGTLTLDSFVPTDQEANSPQRREYRIMRRSFPHSCHGCFEPDLWY